MSNLSPIASLFAGVITFLVLATLIAKLLKYYYRTSSNVQVVVNLNDRINAWWLIIIFLGIAFLNGDLGLVLLFSFVSFLALREFISLVYTRPGDHKALLIIFFVILPVQYFFVHTEWYGMFTIFIPVYAFLLLPVISALSGDETRFFERTAKVQWGLMICVYCISHVPALMTLDIPGYENNSPLLIAYLILVVQFSDVFQYVCGKLFGKRKLAPRLSPSKTVEGFIGGVLIATLLGILLAPFTPFLWWQSGVVSLILTLAGFSGGLVLSAIKRDMKVKDWGTLIEGHGGILDRLDSITFSAPIFFHMVRYWWTL